MQPDSLQTQNLIVSLSIDSCSFKVFDEELHFILATLLLLLQRYSLGFERFLNHDGTCRIGRSRECFHGSITIVNKWRAVWTRTLVTLGIQIIFLARVGVKDVALVSRMVVRV